MKNFRIILLLAISIYFSFSSFGQTTSSGTEFYFSFIQNRIDKNCAPTSSLLSQAEIFIYVNNNSNSPAEVRIDFFGENVNYEIDDIFYTTGSVDNQHDFTLSPDQTSIIRVVPNDSVTYDNVTPGEGFVTVPDYRNIQLTNNCTIQPKVFSILSINEIPVTVFIESTQGASRDATMVLPLGSLGFEYYAFTQDPIPLEYPTSHYGANFGGPAEIAIVGVEDYSQIFFRLPVSMTDLMYATSNVDSNNCATYNGGFTHHITLNKGEAFQLQSDNYDLTGTHIWSSSHFAVFSGNMGARIGCTYIPECGSDYIFEQMFHQKNWSEKSVVPYINNGAYDQIKFISSGESTNIYLNGSLSYTLNTGEIAEYLNNESEPIVIVSTPHPIVIAMYGKSSQYSGGSHQKRDPSLTVIAPLNQRVKEINFSVLPESSWVGACTDIVKEDFLFLVVNSDEKSLVYLDDFINPPMALEEMIGAIVVPWTSLSSDTSLSYCLIDVSNNLTDVATTYRLFMNQMESEGFNAYVTGLDCTESYSYCTGLSIEIDTTTNSAFLDEDFLIKLYPNPVDDKLLIYFKKLITHSFTVSVFDINGKLVKLETFNQSFVSLNMDDLSTGIYVVEVNYDKKFRKKIQVN